MSWQSWQLRVPREADALRILHMIPSLRGGGAERQLAYLSRELVRRGHDVAVLYRAEGVAPWPNAEVPTIRLVSRGAWDPRLVTRAARVIRDFRPDVIQSWIVQMDVIAGMAARLTGVPWILREPTSEEPYRHARLKARLRFASARGRVALVVANSRGGIEYWRAHAPHVKTVLIPNGVPIGDIDAATAADEEAGRGLFVGRIETMKNVDVLIAAARAAGIPLTICGDGPARSRLQSLADDKVVFAGYCSDPWSRMKAASFLASLSDFEGRPNSVLEAFAACVPVILSDIAAHREIADESCAWFVPLKDVTATTHAIRAIRSGGPDVAVRVAEARRRVETVSLEAMTDAFEEIYEKVSRR